MTSVDERIRTWFADELRDAPDAPSVADILARLGEVPVAERREVGARRPRMTWTAVATLAAAVVALIVGIVVLVPSANDPEPAATVSPDDTTATMPPIESTQLAATLPESTQPAPTLFEPPPTTAAPATTPAVTDPPPPPTTALAPVAGDVLGTLSIPVIGADILTVEGHADDRSPEGPAHQPDTPLPDEAVASGSASVIRGHRTTYGAPFLDLGLLRADDEIVWTAPDGALTAFRVTAIEVIDADAEPAPPTGTALTLVTPHPVYSTRQQLLVHAVATGQPPTTPSGPPLVFEDIDDEVVEALTALDSFSTTATVVERVVHPAASGIPEEMTTRGTNRLTMLADGRIWTEGADGGWSSFDPATGVARLGYVDLDGTIKYQEVQGWTDYTTGLMIIAGHIPVMVPGSPSPSSPVIETTFDGRPAWEVRQASDPSSSTRRRASSCNRSASIRRRTGDR